MTLSDSRHTIADVPVRLVHRGSASAAARTGCVLFYHGLGASIDVQTTELVSLAERGFLAVGVDNVGHGARRYPDFDDRFRDDNPDVERVFLEAVDATAAEIPRLVDALAGRGLIHDGRVGAGGISMGGYITYAAVLAEPRLRVVTPIIGSPGSLSTRPGSPHLHPDRFFPVALLACTAELDESVPPRHARDLHQRLAPYYRTAPDRLRYIEVPGSGHFVPEAQWRALWDDVVAWFERFIASPGVPGG